MANTTSIFLGSYLGINGFGTKGQLELSIVVATKVVFLK